MRNENVVNKIKCFPGRFLSGVCRLYGRLVNKGTTLLYQQRISGRSRIKCKMTPSFYNGGFILYTAPISRIRPYGEYRDDDIFKGVGPVFARPARTGAPLRSGFTLIELLVVVLIIGILAAVALPQYQQAVLKSRIMQVLPYLKAVKNAEEAYYLANGEYTSDMDSLSVNGTAPSGWTFYLMENETQTVKAKYQNGPNLHIIASFDHRTDYPEWAGITYCYAITALHKNVCKSMGALIPNGKVSGGSRYYIAN